MKLEDQDIELLEKYLLNNLSLAEKQDLENRLAHEEDLKRALEDIKVLHAAIKKNGRSNLKVEIEAIENELKAKKKIISFQPWTMGIAATLILVVITYLFWPAQNDTQTLFTKYHEPYPNVIMPMVRGKVASDTSLISKAYQAYEYGEYKNAIPIFELHAQQDENAKFYLGNCYLQIGQIDKAIIVFNEVALQSNLFKDQAEWYKGLCYLKKGDIKQANIIMNEIISKNSSYKNKAQNILNDLNQ